MSPSHISKRAIRRFRAKPVLCRRVYERMYAAFGPRHWWPGETAEEVIVGAVLTQNTAWRNVEKALGNLREAGVLGLRELAGLEAGRLADLIRPAGYFNLKARRLQAVARYFLKRCDCDLGRLSGADTGALREELLDVYGVGRETADSILLYALDRPVFVIDAYTLRIGGRHGWFPFDTTYEEARSFFERSVERDVALYNETHALLVAVGANHCKPKPVCDGCPLAIAACGAVRVAM